MQNSTQPDHFEPRTSSSILTLNIKHNHLLRLRVGEETEAPAIVVANGNTAKVDEASEAGYKWSFEMTQVLFKAYRNGKHLRGILTECLVICA